MSRKTLLSPRPAAGFTLVELMITLALGVIILTMAVPSFQSTLRNNRATTQANELLGALTLARSEAVKRSPRDDPDPLKRRPPVSLCARSLSNPATCAGSADWAAGWLVFTDGGAPGVIDGTDEILREWPALVGGATLTGRTLSDPVEDMPYVQFRASGQVQVGGLFTYLPPHCQGEQVRLIDIQLTGRARVRRDNCP